MRGVTIVDHPLVQHKLTLLRRKDTSTSSFRRLLSEHYLWANDRPPFEPARSMEIIQSIMELSATESEKFWPVYREYRNEVNKLGDERVKFIERFAGPEIERAVGRPLAALDLDAEPIPTFPSTSGEIPQAANTVEGLIARVNELP